MRCLCSPCPLFIGLYCARFLPCTYISGPASQPVCLPLPVHLPSYGSVRTPLVLIVCRSSSRLVSVSLVCISVSRSVAPSLAASCFCVSCCVHKWCCCCCGRVVWSFCGVVVVWWSPRVAWSTVLVMNIRLACTCGCCLDYSVCCA